MSSVRERRAKIFRNGRSRAVRIPADFKLDAEEVILRQADNGEITILPLSDTAAFLEALRTIQAAYPLDREENLSVDGSDLLPLKHIEFDGPEDPVR